MKAESRAEAGEIVDDRYVGGKSGIVMRRPDAEKGDPEPCRSVAFRDRITDREDLGRGKPAFPEDAGEGDRLGGWPPDHIREVG